MTHSLEPHEDEGGDFCGNVIFIPQRKSVLLLFGLCVVVQECARREIYPAKGSTVVVTTCPDQVHKHLGTVFQHHFFCHT